MSDQDKRRINQTALLRKRLHLKCQSKTGITLFGGEVLQSLFIRKSFEEEIQEIANQNNFQQIHKSFLVNLDYVKQLTPDSVIMKSGIELPVSKGKAAKVKREYLLFISAQYR